MIKKIKEIQIKNRWQNKKRTRTILSIVNKKVKLKWHKKNQIISKSKITIKIKPIRKKHKINRKIKNKAKINKFKKIII
jgi:hypothetical protein